MGKEARAFSTSKAYYKGDLTLYEGKLYQFNQTHSAGAWNSAHADPVDSSAELDLARVLAGMENADKAADYADTVIFEPELIEGTRYKYVLTNAPDPR